MIKKLLIILAVCTLGLTACTQNEKPSDTTVSTTQPEIITQTLQTEIEKKNRSSMNIAALKGPTGLGLLNLFEETEENKPYNISLVGAPDEIVGKLATGEIDIAAVPTNLASSIYNKTEGKIQVVAVNTLGVLYLLENGHTVNSVEDLKGKTIYVSGQGATPEYVLNYLIANSTLTEADVDIVFKSEHAEVASLMIANKTSLALLPEPFVTQTVAKNEEVRIALDMTKEWEKVSGKKLAMGVLVARKEFIEQNKDSFYAFMDSYTESVNFVNSNVVLASEMSDKAGIMPADVAKKAIPNCNIVLITGDDMKKIVSENLTVLFEANPKSIGGKIPDEKFYY